jgi:hypothetical protein
VRKLPSFDDRVNRRGADTEALRNLTHRQQAIPSPLHDSQPSRPMQQGCSKKFAKPCYGLGSLDSAAAPPANSSDNLRSVATAAQRRAPHSGAVGRRFDSCVARRISRDCWEILGVELPPESALGPIGAAPSTETFTPVSQSIEAPPDLVCRFFRVDGPSASAAAIASSFTTARW